MPEHPQPELGSPTPSAHPNPLLPGVPAATHAPSEDARNADAPDAAGGVLPRLVRGAAFGFSAVLSPYIVLPVGTAAIISSLVEQKRQWMLYAFISVLFSTILPALFVVVQVKRGKITDVHIMDRSQRGAPFWVAIASSAIGAFVLWRIGAPMNVWSISAVLSFNGLILTWVTSFWKISMHVAVLTATVTAALMMIPQVQPAPLLALVPALMWARVTRGRHTLWQGLAGAALSSFITGLCFFSLRFAYNDPAAKAAVRSFLHLS